MIDYNIERNKLYGSKSAKFHLGVKKWYIEITNIFQLLC